MILRSPTEHENADLRHAGMDGRHPGSQDAFEHHPCQPIVEINCGAADKVSIHHQLKNRQADRCDDSPVGALSSGQSDQVRTGEYRVSGDEWIETKKKPSREESLFCILLLRFARGSS